MGLFSEKRYAGIETVRELFAPVQPAVRQSATGVAYREVLPLPALRPFIHCYWELQATKALQDAYAYRVVPDGCIDIFFSLDKPVDSFIMGFSQAYTDFDLGQSFHYAGIRFLPTMLPQLFSTSAGELSGSSVDLASVLPKVAASITESLSSETRLPHVWQFLDQYFLRHLGTIDLDPDPRVANAVSLILKNNGNIAVERGLDIGVSPRQLRRLFDFYIGDSAKMFAQVVRYQWVLRSNSTSQHPQQEKFYFDAGFYDQAHFVHTFKRFHGCTPSEAFGS